MATTADERQLLAAELADLLIDGGLERGGIGEAEKTFSYFRAVGSRDLMLQMLQQRAKPQQPFYQTRRTVEHHEKLLVVLREFLADHRNLSDPDLLDVFGWAIRLSRYRDQMRAGPLSMPRTRPTGNQPPQLPGIGDVLTGKVVEMDDDLVVIEIPKFSQERAIAVMKLGAGQRPRYRVEYPARVSVQNVRTLRNGRVVLEVLPAAGKA